MAPWQARHMLVAPDGAAVTIDGPARSITRAVGEPLSLELPAAPDGSQVAVYIPQEVGVEGFTITRRGGDHELAAPPAEDGYVRFLCVAPACADARLDVALASDERFTAFVTQMTPEEPQDGRDLLQARPADAAPRHVGDATILVERIVVHVE